LDATLLDREADRSLTTDTMCQNLFDPNWSSLDCESSQKPVGYFE
jgi:hypothetical protein